MALTGMGTKQATTPRPDPLICTPSGVQLAVMTHAHDGEAQRTLGAAWLVAMPGRLSWPLDSKDSWSHKDPSDPWPK